MAIQLAERALSIPVARASASTGSGRSPETISTAKPIVASSAQAAAAPGRGSSSNANAASSAPSRASTVPAFPPSVIAQLARPRRHVVAPSRASTPSPGCSLTASNCR